MEENKEELIVDLNHESVQMIPLAYHEVCMQRAEARDENNRKALLRTIIAFAVSLVLTCGIFAYMWLQYDYASTEEYSGVYVLRDSEGNAIASDIKPDDVIKILEVLESGKSADNANQDKK